MDKKLTFIDLFAGIGGFHIALRSLKMKCVLTCEIDKYARETYFNNFKEPYLKDKNLFPKDIWNIDFKKIPNFDILCAGFPCQPFSQVGQKKGFKDNKSGNLFFAIEEILKIKKPLAFILENVSFLKNHDDGKTFKIIRSKLQKLNYTFDAQILKASNYGLPTYRPRIFMVGFYKPKIKRTYKELAFTFPNKINLKKTISDVMGGFCSTDFTGKKERKIGFTMRVGGGRSGVLDRRNWDSYIVNKKEVRISPRQGLELMGFPKTFKFPVSNSQALKQLGNSVATKVVQAVAKEVQIYIKNYIS